MTFAYGNHSSDLSINPDFFQLVTGSYSRIVGRPLVDDGQGANWLYNDAPFVILAHNTDLDPRFVYANRTAQQCFGYSWDEFIALPSRLPAELPDREERKPLLDAIERDSFIDSYRGLRIAKSGRRFWIEQAIVWELIDETGKRMGQAATFSSWRDQ